MPKSRMKMWFSDGLGGVACFAIQGHPTWDIAISYSKSGYLSSGAKEFIRLTEEYYNESF